MNLEEMKSGLEVSESNNVEILSSVDIVVNYQHR